MRTQLAEITKRIEALRSEGYIRDEESVSFLTDCLENNLGKEIQEIAAQTIIEEVIGAQNKELRLKALEKIKPWIKTSVPRPSKGQIDLHTHDYFSEDGYPTPTALILEAYKEGLDTVGILCHNTRYADEEAELAAASLGIQLFKGGEASTYVQLGSGHRENIHLSQIYTEEADLESMRGFFQEYLYNFQEYFKGINYDFQQALNDPMTALLYLREERNREHTRNLLRHIQDKYGTSLALTEDELAVASRGDTIYPFTIAVALWNKYKDIFQDGFELDPGDPASRKPLKGVNEVYDKIIRTYRKDEGSEGSSSPPDINNVAQRAIVLKRKLIIPHPNECSREAFEKALADLAVVEVGGKRYAGLLTGVEYYCHKLQGKARDYVKSYVTWLNENHPVYREFPLLLLPGSDYHGKFSPSYPLGLSDNYPSDIEGYNEEVLKALLKPPTPL